MSSALSLNFIDWIKRVGVSRALKFVNGGLVNILHVCFVIRNVGDSVLFQLCRSCFVDVRHIHIVASFKPFLVSVGFDLSACNVFNIQLVVNKPLFFDGTLALNSRLKQLRKWVLYILISGSWHLSVIKLPLINVFLVSVRFVMLLFESLEARLCSVVQVTLVIFTCCSRKVLPQHLLLRNKVFINLSIILNRIRSSVWVLSSLGVVTHI